MDPELEQIMAEGLALVQSACGRIAREHGFWINRESPDRLLMLMVGELSEAHEDLRSGRAPQEIYYEDRADTPVPKPCGFGVELADAVIRIFDAAAQLDIDLGKLILEKMQFNESRPYLHGRKF